MKYKYMLFDLDGTLTDSQEGIIASVRYALEKMGIHEENDEKIRPFLGPPLKESFMKYYGMSEEQALQSVDKYREWFVPKGIFQNKMYPGVADMLRRLKESGHVLAVASSKPEVFVKQILEHFGVAVYFDFIVGSELDGRRSEKEEVVEEALSRLSAMGQWSPEEGVMVGDRMFDIQGGKAHGLSTVGVSYGYAKAGELEQAQADYLAATVEELIQFIDQ